MAKLVPYRGGPLMRLREAIRSYVMGPVMSSDPRAADFFGYVPTSTGIHVNETTALNYSSVWAAVTLISSQVGNLPLMFYRKLPNGGKDPWPDNPLYRLVHDRPNTEMSALVFREILQSHALLWGNAYAEIQRNGAGRPTALWPITPDRVTPYRDSNSGPLQYRVLNGTGNDVYIDAVNMLHVPGYSYDGICGYSVISKMRESIGLGLAAEQFGGTFFGNGATFGGVISYPGQKPTELADKNYRDELNSRHQGVARAHKLLALYNGAKYEPTGIPPNDAQFLETRQFQVDEIARWFNVPPHKLKQLLRATYDTIEHQQIEYLTDCLAPWLKRWEQELCEKLIPASERNLQAIEFVVEGLLRGDAVSRGDFQSKQFSIAALTPNETRTLESRNPISGGDDAFVPLNLIPLKLAGPYYQSLIDANEAKAKADLRPPPEPGPTPAQQQQQKQREDELIADRDLARKKAQEYEDAADLARAQAHDAAITLKGLDAERMAERLASETASALWAQERSAFVADLTKAQAQIEEARTAKELADALSAERLVAIQRVTGERDSVTRDREQERLSHQQTKEALSLDITAIQQEREAAVTRGEVAQNAADAALAQATSLGTDLIAAMRDITIAKERIDLIGADYQRVCGEKQALTVRADTADVLILELRGQIEAFTKETPLLVAAIAEAKEQAGRAEEAREEALRKRDAFDQQVRLHAAEVERAEQRTRATQQGLRGVLVHNIGCLITREADRARKSAGTPEKFGKWIEAFYPMHEDFCRSALKPALSAWLVANGSDLSPDRFLDRVLPGYLGEATRQLKGLAQEHDQESLGPALERLLRRWESERAEAWADRITKEAA